MKKKERKNSKMGKKEEKQDCSTSTQPAPLPAKRGRGRPRKQIPGTGPPIPKVNPVSLNLLEEEQPDQNDQAGQQERNTEVAVVKPVPISPPILDDQPEENAYQTEGTGISGSIFSSSSVGRRVTRARAAAALQRSDNTVRIKEEPSDDKSEASSGADLFFEALGHDYHAHSEAGQVQPPEFSVPVGFVGAPNQSQSPPVPPAVEPCTDLVAYTPLADRRCQLFSTSPMSSALNVASMACDPNDASTSSAVVCCAACGSETPSTTLALRHQLGLQRNSEVEVQKNLIKAYDINRLLMNEIAELKARSTEFEIISDKERFRAEKAWEKLDKVSIYNRVSEEAEKQRIYHQNRFAEKIQEMQEQSDKRARLLELDRGKLARENEHLNRKLTVGARKYRRMKANFINMRRISRLLTSLHVARKFKRVRSEVLFSIANLNQSAWDLFNNLYDDTNAYTLESAGPDFCKEALETLRKRMHKSGSDNENEDDAGLMDTSSQRLPTFIKSGDNKLLEEVKMNLVADGVTTVQAPPPTRELITDGEDKVDRDGEEEEEEEDSEEDDEDFIEVPVIDKSEIMLADNSLVVTFDKIEEGKSELSMPSIFGSEFTIPSEMEDEEAAGNVENNDPDTEIINEMEIDKKTDPITTPGIVEDELPPAVTGKEEIVNKTSIGAIDPASPNMFLDAPTGPISNLFLDAPTGATPNLFLDIPHQNLFTNAPTPNLFLNTPAPKLFTETPLSKVFTNAGPPRNFTTAGPPNLPMKAPPQQMKASPPNLPMKTSPPPMKASPPKLPMKASFPPMKASPSNLPMTASPPSLSTNPPDKRIDDRVQGELAEKELGPKRSTAPPNIDDRQKEEELKTLATTTATAAKLTSQHTKVSTSTRNYSDSNKDKNSDNPVVENWDSDSNEHHTPPLIHLPKKRIARVPKRKRSPSPRPDRRGPERPSTSQQSKRRKEVPRGKERSDRYPRRDNIPVGRPGKHAEPRMDFSRHHARDRNTYSQRQFKKPTNDSLRSRLCSENLIKPVGLSTAPCQRMRFEQHLSMKADERRRLNENKRHFKSTLSESSSGDEDDGRRRQRRSSHSDTSLGGLIEENPKQRKTDYHYSMEELFGDEGSINDEEEDASDSGSNSGSVTSVTSRSESGTSIASNRRRSSLLNLAQDLLLSEDDDDKIDQGSDYGTKDGKSSQIEDYQSTGAAADTPESPDNSDGEGDQAVGGLPAPVKKGFMVPIRKVNSDLHAKLLKVLSLPIPRVISSSLNEFMRTPPDMKELVLCAYTIVTQSSDEELCDSRVRIVDTRDIPLIPRFAKLFVILQKLSKAYTGGPSNHLFLEFMRFISESILPNDTRREIERTLLLEQLGRLVGAMSSQTKSQELAMSLIFDFLLYRPPFSFPFAFGVMCSDSGVLGFSSAVMSFSDINLTTRAVIYSLARNPRFSKAKMSDSVSHLMTKSFLIPIPEVGFDAFISIVLNEVYALESERELAKASRVIAMLAVQKGWEWINSGFTKIIIDFLEKWKSEHVSDGVLASVVEGLGWACSSLRRGDAPTSLENQNRILDSLRHVKTGSQPIQAALSMASLMLKEAQVTSRSEPWRYETKRSHYNKRNMDTFGKRKNKKKKRKVASNNPGRRWK